MFYNPAHHVHVRTVVADAEFVPFGPDEVGWAVGARIWRADVLDESDNLVEAAESASLDSICAFIQNWMVEPNA